MSIFESYLQGLAVTHLVWFYFFATGQLLRPRGEDERKNRSLADLVCTSAAGMALAGFGLLLLGFTHLLTQPGIVGALIVEGVLFWWLRRENWLSWRFWLGTLRKMLAGWTPAACFVYLVLIVVGLPAVLPPTAGDAAWYHLPYAVDWANAGRIYVDPFLRFPFYANNFLLLYSGLFVLKLGRFCQFLTWLCGLLSCLGVLAFFSRSEMRADPARVRWTSFQPEEFLLPLGLALSPTFLPVLTQGVPDVPIGLFLLVPVLCAYRGTSEQPLERELVVSGAFCAGMKMTLIGEVPLFVASLLYTCWRRVSRRRLALLILGLLALSLPWYVRNWIGAGDPVAPLFNRLLHHPDPIFSEKDISLYGRDLLAKRDPLQVLLLPIRFFTEPTAHPFGAHGVSTMVMLVYVPLLLLIAQLWPRRTCWAPRPLIYLSAAMVYLVAPWFLSSDARHSVHWYPVLAGWIGVVIAWAIALSETRWRSAPAVLSMRLATAVLSAILVCPTPAESSAHFYRHYYRWSVPLSASRVQLKTYLKKRVRTFCEGWAAIESLSTHDHKGRVFLFGRVTPSLFFHEAGIVTVGDWFGPARFTDFIEQVMQGDCRPFLERLRVVAILFDRDLKLVRDLPLMHQKLRAQLKQNGFVEYRCRKDGAAVFLKSDIPPSPRLVRAEADALPPAQQP